ncbi:MAG TPA: hypothetical protein VNR18_06225 [Hyphomicrobiales bacterium]|nr:hypothetical protein [Hyphomicrobiales bacterium]
MPQIREDQDSPWKEALAVFFESFLQLLYPAIHRAIDWSHRATFLDKELQKLTPDGSTGRRYADKLAQVWLPS